MTEKRRRIAGTISLALGLVVLMFILLLSAVHAVGTDGALYNDLQNKAWAALGANNPTGVSDEDLRMLDGELAKYLAGRENELLMPMDSEPGAYSVLPVAIYGTLRPAFNEREVTHLVDCHDLFALLRKVRARLVPWAVLLVTLGAYLLRDRSRIRRIAWLSPLAVIAPLGAFAAWAALSFDAAFTFFHRILFTNDLWLLDPATDLLIRMCPQEMFAAMGVRIAVIALAAMAAAALLATLLTHIWPKRREANTWKDNRTARGAAQRPKTFDVGAKR